MSADTTTQTDARPPFMGSPFKDKSSKRKSPLVDEAYYSEAIAVLQSLPKFAHPVWATLKDELRNAPSSERAKSVLYQKLEKVCAEEELDWKRFDVIKTVCQHMPNVIQVDMTAGLLYRLMGVQTKESAWSILSRNYLCRKALIQDEESVEAITIFLSLLEFFQKDKCPADLHPVLLNKCHKVERLLEKNRGAPKIRQFMELWDKTAGNESEDDGDDKHEEDETPSQKRRCIKAEELE